jgi:hypothetical protein
MRLKNSYYYDNDGLYDDVKNSAGSKSGIAISVYLLD